MFKIIKFVLFKRRDNKNESIEMMLKF